MDFSFSFLCVFCCLVFGGFFLLKKKSFKQVYVSQWESTPERFVY